VSAWGVVLVPFWEVSDVVEPWLELTCPSSKPSQGIPAHVTLLFPLPVDADGVGAALEGARPFDVEFRTLRRFPTTLWLAPEPAEPFVRLTEALVARFPEWLPYGGAFDAIVPHLTVAQGDAAALGAAERDVAPLLPLGGRASEAILLAEVEPDTWVPQATFPFRAA
jgi:2'-5' RNA ligase